jgi:outer membrane receptor protein involved in Fe transport
LGSEPSPIQVVGFKDIALSGKTDAFDLLNELPQNFQNSQSDFSSQSNPLNAAGGIATADLRGLGPQRTLVLVNGVRLGPGDGNTANPNPGPDLNQIPSQLIDHVEILTGGASSTYGSDAIAGVVNFVMKQNFQGVQLDYQQDVDQHTNHDGLAQSLIAAAGFPQPTHDQWDGRARDVSLILGQNSPDGKGNITAYYTYKDQDPVTQGTRDFSACKLGVHANGDPYCTGSPNSNQFFESGSNDQYSVSGNQFVPYGTVATTPPALFNSNPYQYLVHQDTRYSYGVYAHYDIAPWAKFYTTLSYMHDLSSTIVAPSGLFEFGNPYTDDGSESVNCDNPLLSAQERSTICTPQQIAAKSDTSLIIGRRNIEGGGRTSEYNHTNYRAVVGLKGDIDPVWSYDVYGQYYNSKLISTDTNYFSLTNVANALEVVSVNGVPTCKVKVANPSSTCVPYNIFQDGGVTSAALNYLNVPATQSGTILEETVAGNITGQLGKYGVQSPWAKDGVGVNIGVEHRRDILNFVPDAASLSGDLSGYGGAATPIRYAALGVTEEFAEFRAPIANDLPFVYEASIEAGYRYSQYSFADEDVAHTYKVGGDWSPIHDIRFRASYDQAIRAPNLIELDNPDAVTTTSDVASDDCAPTGNGTIAAKATLAQCMRSGVTAAQYGNGLSTDTIPQCPASQCSTLTGGNPGLKPEEAKTYSVGVTVTPRFLSGFSGSIDYYDIKETGLVGSLPLAFVYQSCLSSGAYCDQVKRSPTGGLVGVTVAGGGYIEGTDVNVAEGENSGIDFQADYHVPLEDLRLGDNGTLIFSFDGAYLLKNVSQSTPQSAKYDCAGLYGAVCQTVNPRWRHNVRLSWQTPWNVLLSAQWRYIGGTSLDTNNATVESANNLTDAYDAYDAHLSAISYLDLATVWTIEKHLAIRAGVNNILDTDPPVVNAAISGTGSPNTYPTYDLVGREIFVAVTAKF